MIKEIKKVKFESDYRRKDVLLELQTAYETHARAIKLVERFYRETHCEVYWFDASDTFIEWLSGLLDGVSSGTFGRYRKWLSSYADNLGCDLLADRIDSLNRSRRRSGGSRRSSALERKEALSDHHKSILSARGHSHESRNKSRSLRSQYADHIDSSFIRSLGGALMSSKVTSSGDRYSEGFDAFGFLRAGILTGLRPIEWSTVEFHNQMTNSFTGEIYRNVLEVKNAKRKSAELDKERLSAYSEKKTIDKRDQQEMFEDRRMLILDTFTEEEIDFLCRFIAVARTRREEYGKWYESCRQTMRRALDRLKDDKDVPGPVFSLYSARHLFASEVRRSDDYSKPELAALLGHGTTRNQQYYGDIRNHTDRLFNFSLPRAWPQAAEAVHLADLKAIEEQEINRLRLQGN